MNKALLAALVAAVSCLQLSGQESHSESIHYDRASAVERALAYNKGLIAARVAVQQAEARLEASSVFPNPSLDIEYEDDFLFNDEGEQTFGLGISQRFPIAGKLAKQKELTRFDIDIAKLEVRQKELDLIAEISDFALDIHLVDTRLENLLKLGKKLSEIVDFAEEKAASGELSPLDASRLKLEQRVLEQEMEHLELRRERLLHRLAPLLGHPATEHFAFDSANALPYTDREPPGYEPEVLDRLPTYQLTTLQQAMAEAKVELALANNWDDLTAKLFWKSEKTIDQPIGRVSDQLLGVSLSIPLPFRKKGSLEANQHRLEQTRSRLAADAIAFDILNEIEHARHEAAISKSRMTSYQSEVIEYAEQQLESIQSAYLNGQIDMLSLLQAQQNRVSLENGYLDLYEEYAHALIELEIARADYQ